MKAVARCPTRVLYAFGDFRLDATKRRLFRSATVVPLPRKAIETLIVLVQNAGETLERETLLDAVWGDAIIEDANLTVAFSQLRKAFGRNDDDEEFIETIPRVGYRFVAKLHPAAETLNPTREPMTQNVAEDISVTENDMKSRETSRISLAGQSTSLPWSFKRFSPVRAGAITVGLLVLIMCVVLTHRHAAGRSVDPSKMDSLAVLPLENLTGESPADYLTDGLTEELINELSKLDHLKVVSRSSVCKFKGRQIDPREVGKALNVEAILEGAIAKTKELDRLSLRLVDTQDGRVMWASDISEHSLGDFLAIEGKLTHDIAAVIRPALRDKQLVGRQKMALAVSRKVHGTADNFDIPLPLIGSPGIECRHGGTTNDYQIVVTFDGSVTVNGNPQAQVTVGSGTIGCIGVANGGMVRVNGATVTIPLTNVANNQTLNVTLNQVNGAHNLVIPMTLLVGDIEGNGAVDISDVGEAKARIGQIVDATNFRSDVNADGAIDPEDILLVTASSGHGLR